MLPDTVNGLPLHPLTVHATVVLVPLAALLGVTFAIPALRAWSRWPLALVSVGAALATFVSVESGKTFEESLGLSGPLEELVEHHAELAQQLLWMIVAYAVLAVVTAAVAGRSGSRGASSGSGSGSAAGATAASGRSSLGVLGVLLTLVVVIGAGALTFQTYRVGDAGSEAVWGSATG